MALRRLNELNHSEVIKMLESDGVAIVDNTYDEQTLTGLKNELYKILESNKPVKGIDHIDYSVGKGKIIKINEVSSIKIPFTFSTFRDDRFRKISEDYFRSDYELNSDIYVVKDVIDSNHYANEFHFDVVPTLKFLIYISDTTELNGAMECIPGSHRETELIRKKHGVNISYENRIISRTLPVEKFPIPVPIKGKAGTLVIFHTDIWHRAGKVSQGERLVMRGHTRRKEDCLHLEKAAKYNLLNKIMKIFIGTDLK